MYASVSVDGFIADENDQPGSVHAQHLLEDPDAMIQGNRVLHLRYRVRRGSV